MAHRHRKNMAKMEAVQPISETECVEYAIYLRKSTEDDEKQKESIPQQLEKCYSFAQKSNDLILRKRTRDLDLDEKTLDEIGEAFASDLKKCSEIRNFYIEHYIVSERKSAKVPYKRESWKKLINEVKNGNIRGLFGYAPDRFSRNLQEGGELIQLVDQKILELKFTNFVFEDNASGHMMLGIFFVFAEHYSKKLSEDSTRGIKHKTLEGKTGGAKKTGYKKSDDDQDKFIPDEPNFSLLRKAFLRKIRDNWSDGRIAEEMMQNGWNEPEEITADMISRRNIWRDTFFFGIWHREFKDDPDFNVDLRKIESYDFQPLVSEEEFLDLQNKLIRQNRKSQEQRQSRFTKRLDIVTPFEKDIVIDADTGKPLSFSIPNRKRFSEKLEESQKTNPGATLANIVLPHQIKYFLPRNNTTLEVLSEYLEKQFKKIKINKEDYQAFLYALREEVKHKFEERNVKLRSITLLESKNKKKEEDFIEENLGKTRNQKEEAVYQKKLDKFKTEEERLMKEKLKISQEVRDEILEQQAFYELILNLPKLWKKASYVQKFKLSQILILNIKVKNGKPISMKVKPEFEHMFFEKNDGGATR